ncbi:MAG: chemotaxis protein CheW [Pseudomonas sp.]|uniref:chemotaxis protein CheW n=1 Tax=Pseudomonas sp. TaxID=306 RepID=UPI0027374E9D|nr:chemotaxis protein CheW [Pseudomonas sp.]MDP3846869.1 chemotaxis protein CheW [Pseudomonas sp.]MDZ4260837.1 chemotaxis protein CheW [Pseudomonadota bacterium]
MNTEYLIALIGKIKIGIDCHDILNVYRQKLKIIQVSNQDDIYAGITSLANQTLPVIDLRKRAQMQPATETGVHNIITFQTGTTRQLAILVDDIIGMEGLNLSSMQKANSNLHNQQSNLNLLFPMIAILKDKSLLHIMDSTYLDNLKPINEDSGELEMF